MLKKTNKQTQCQQICFKVGGSKIPPAIQYFSLPSRCAIITVINDVLMSFSCGQMTGRYVNIVIPGAGQRLQLCEVRVYASTDITGGKTTLINDTYSWFSYGLNFRVWQLLTIYLQCMIIWYIKLCILYILHTSNCCFFCIVKNISLCLQKIYYLESRKQ